MRCQILSVLGLVVAYSAISHEAHAADQTEKRIALPQELRLPHFRTGDEVLRSWDQIETRFKAGDPYITSWVEERLSSARKWANRPDSYYLGLFRPESPFGRRTITCPFHPEMFGWMPFDWDPDKPWRLTCPDCSREGRNPDYYPNELYPDDGKGCAPTDEAWRKTHTPEWSAKYGIPWDRWDGRAHGGVDGFRFFFLGYAQFRIFFELNWRRNILGSLSDGYVLGSRLYPSGSDEYELAQVCARKAKIIMVTMSRAIMGDAYLQKVTGIGPQSYRRAVEVLSTASNGQPLRYEDYPGYEKRDVISDHSRNDPEHPLETVRSHWRKQTTIFPSRNHAGWSNAWLTSYAKIQSSFTPAERKAGLTELIERLLVSKAGDAERLEGSGWELRRGVLELGVDLHNLKLKGNLAGGKAWSTLNFGLILNDKDIIRTVAAAVHTYLRSYFTRDGLGREVSPHYTHVALSNLRAPMAALEGMKEGFGPGDPFWDPQK